MAEKAWSLNPLGLGGGAVVEVELVALWGGCGPKRPSSGNLCLDSWLRS